MKDIIKELRETGMSMEDAKRLAPIIVKRDNRIAELEEEVQQLTNQLIAMHKGDNV